MDIPQLRIVRELLAKDDMDQVFSFLLKEMPQSDECHDDIVNLSGRYESVKKSLIKGIITNTDVTLEFNIIRNNVLEISRKYFSFSAIENITTIGIDKPLPIEDEDVDYLEYLEIVQDRMIDFLNHSSKIGKYIEDWKNKTFAANEKLQAALKSNSNQAKPHLYREAIAKISKDSLDYSKKMNGQLPVYISISEDIITNHYKAFGLLKKGEIKDKVMYLDRMLNDAKSLLLIYQKMQENQIQGKNYNLTLGPMSHDFVKAVKSVSKMYGSFLTNTNTCIEKTNQYIVEIQTEIDRENGFDPKKKESFWQWFWRKLSGR